MLSAKVELLQQIPLFEGLSHSQLTTIAEAGEKSFFAENDRLLVEGQKGTTAFLIMSGKASCPKREKGETLYEDLWPGTLVGELAMLVETEHNITVTARERVRALAFHRDAFKEIMERDAQLAQHIANKLLVRLNGLAKELREVDSKLAEIEKAA